jgi:CubicO group peptidase (beta-lactamase class C family)
MTSASTAGLIGEDARDQPKGAMTGELTQSGLEQLHDVAERHVGETAVPGLVTLVAHGEDVYVEALGSLSVGGPPVVRDSLFRIASTTKPITGAATLALIDEGLIELDEPVDRLLPNWPTAACSRGWMDRLMRPYPHAARSPFATC